jgi:ribosomal protein S18 acetylase RimI-like enzyme
MTVAKGDVVRRTANLYAEAFRDDPVFVYLLCNFSAEQRYQYLPEYFEGWMRAGQLNHGLFLELGDWSSCAVVMPPGRHPSNIWTLLPGGIIGVAWKVGFSGCMRILAETAPLGDAARAKVLTKKEPYFYLWFIATATEHRGKGLSSELLRRIQGRAQQAGLPVWLEASTEYSYRLYEKLGFELVERLVLGKGKATKDGTPQVGGEGISLWAMIWWPRGSESLEKPA